MVNPRKAIHSRAKVRTQNHPTQPKPRSLNRMVRLAIWRWRYLCIAIAAGIAAVGVTQIVVATPEPATTVLVAARPIQLGAVITDADLTEMDIQFPDVINWIATDSATAVGATAVSAFAVGTPIWLDLLAINDSTSLAPPGTVIVAVQLDAAVATFLAPGDRVDLVDSRAESATHLARSALVLPPRSAAAQSQRMLGIGGVAGSGAAGQTATIFAVAPSEAPELAVAARFGQVSAILVG